MANCGLTIEAVDEEIIRTQKMPMSMGNLERFNVLCKAKTNLIREMPGLTEHEAQEWVDKMNPPAKWTLAQTNSVRDSKGFTCDPYVFWAVMNSLFSDYGSTVAKYGVDKAEFWADMAYDWIHDKDAHENKASVYYHAIVK